MPPKPQASPFLSIVTISFNQAAFLRQALESVLSQKSEDVEYIVVDAGSTDGSRAILEDHRSAIDHLVLEPDDGPADGLNKGFARARGRYGYFINADDFLLPAAVEKLRRRWQESPDADVIFCAAWMVDTAGGPLREMVPTRISRSTLREGSVTIVQQGISFRLDTFRQTRGFNVQNHTCWDEELVIDLICAGARPRVFFDRIGAFRIHAAGISARSEDSGHLARYRADSTRAYSKVLPAAKAAPGTLRVQLGRLLKFWRNPRALLARGRDRFFPAAMNRRWRSDLRLGRARS